MKWSNGCEFDLFEVFFLLLFLDVLIFSFWVNPTSILYSREGRDNRSVKPLLILRSPLELRHCSPPHFILKSIISLSANKKEIT